MKTHNVLDHGYVTLVDSMGTDESIIEAARMSTGKGFKGWGTPEKPGDEKLLEYLYKHEHSSPFEMCELVVDVQAPIFVARQWMRHRTFSFNEHSARYSELPDLYYAPMLDRIKAQSKTNKQASGGELSDELKNYFLVDVNYYQGRLGKMYREFLDAGIARETARLLAPVSQYTRFRVKGNLRNWLHFLKLRMDPAAQEEIRLYAEAVGRFVQDLWPRSYDLFQRYTLERVTISREEYEGLKSRDRLAELTAIGQAIGEYNLKGDKK